VYEVALRGRLSPLKSFIIDPQTYFNSLLIDHFAKHFGISLSWEDLVIWIDISFQLLKADRDSSAGGRLPAEIAE
jgi:hypothetical protein